MGHQSTGGPFCVSRWAWRYRTCIWAPPQLGLRHWPPILRDVMLFHKPGAWAARPLEELEGDKGLQERRLSLAEVSRRESGLIALARIGCRAHSAHTGAGRLPVLGNQASLRCLEIQ